MIRNGVNGMVGLGSEEGHLPFRAAMEYTSFGDRACSSEKARAVSSSPMTIQIGSSPPSPPGLANDSYASLKSLRPMDSTGERVSDGSNGEDPGNPTAGFHGLRRTNATRRSLTDPEARLYKKSLGLERSWPTEPRC